MSGLAVTGAEVRYGDLVAVDDVDLAVAPGEIVALLGASGSGKSSLLRGVAGLEPLTAGRVCWSGDDLSSVPVHKRGFGMMFQDGQLFAHLSVEGNIAYGLFREPKQLRRERVTELLDVVGLAGYGKRRVSELSGGQAQRVALARAVLLAPSVILADEPTASLDDDAAQAALDLLQASARRCNATLVIATHDRRVEQALPHAQVQFLGIKSASGA